MGMEIDPGLRGEAGAAELLGFSCRKKILGDFIGGKRVQSSVSIRRPP
jgi:hypothetical protein